jgi:PilZ domain
MVPFGSTKELRRSTRVSLEVSIDVEDENSKETLTGATQVVNLHGALIRTVRPLRPGSQISITVYLTGKKSRAKVVYLTADNPLKAGIELHTPQNIWGVSLAPQDWDDMDRHR